MNTESLLSLLGTICPNCASGDCAQHERYPAWGAMQRRAESLLAQVLRELPSGSGFDDRPELLKLTSDRLVLRVPFHPLSEHGFYKAWVNLRVTVRSTFGGPDITVTGGRDADLRSYVGEVYHEALTADCWTQRFDPTTSTTTIERVNA